MLSRWLSVALLWVLSLAVAGVYGQNENDFENDPNTKRVAVSLLWAITRAICAWIVTDLCSVV